MSPIVIIVFAPVVVLGILFYSVLLGAVAAGIWEAAERRAERRLSTPGLARSQAAPQGSEYPRAA
jgi:hypothetical protein